MKLKFNINSNVVKSKNNLEIARKYHHYDNVESIHVTANEDVYHIDAVVSVFNHPQKCSLDIKDNQVISYECSCPFNDQDSMCGHLGAVILKLNELEIFFCFMNTFNNFIFVFKFSIFRSHKT